MSNEELIISYRPLLVKTAQQVLGTLSDAEDVVQDTLIKFLKVDLDKIDDVKSYLTRSVRNNCLNYLESVKNKQETNISNWLSSPLFECHFEINLSKLEFRQELFEGIKTFMTRLDSKERAVFTLKELFNFNYSELTEILEKKADNCRQIFSRAKSKLTEKNDRFDLDTEKHEEFFDKLINAWNQGDLSDLIAHFQNDIKDNSK